MRRRRRPAAAAAGSAISTPSTPRPRGRSPIRAVRLLVDAGGQEALERLALGVEHAERRVARAGELARRLEQPLEDELDVQLRDERAPGVEQARRAVGIERGVLHARIQPAQPRVTRLSASP